jgi:peptide-methionine (S)-S-oxide reductase
MTPAPAESHALSILRSRVIGSLVALTGLALVPGSAGAERAVPLPAPARDVAARRGLATAVLAGGCFWGVEAVFEQLRGVRSVTSGYAGGTRATATYDQVSTERTGHAEAVRIVYDPRQVSYGTLLRVFFSVAHDPTQVGGQGPDRGPSYRSAIFPQTPGQRGVAAAYLAQLRGAFAKPLTTRIETGQFFPAEASHQDFARRNPSHPYIVRWDAPKVAALRAGYPRLVR